MRRLVVVGGAGTLEVAPGVRVMDKLGIPEVYKRQVVAQAALLDLIRETAGDLEWTYISPAGDIEPGERTGAYRVGGYQLIVWPGAPSLTSPSRWPGFTA